MSTHIANYTNPSSPWFIHIYIRPLTYLFVIRIDPNSNKFLWQAHYLINTTFMFKLVLYIMILVCDYFIDFMDICNPVNTSWYIALQKYNLLTVPHSYFKLLWSLCVHNRSPIEKPKLNSGIIIKWKIEPWRPFFYLLTRLTKFYTSVNNE